MKRLKRFNEIQEQPKSGDYSYNDNGSVVHSDLLQSNTYGDLSMHNPYYDNENDEEIIKFEDFAENRLNGATKISHSAEEKGGDALLTYHHFKVKLPFYEEATNGKFNNKKAKVHYDNLVEELFNRGINFEQIEFQEILGKIEVIGELLIKSKDLI